MTKLNARKGLYGRALSGDEVPICKTGVGEEERTCGGRENLVFKVVVKMLLAEQSIPKGNSTWQGLAAWQSVTCFVIETSGLNPALK